MQERGDVARIRRFTQFSDLYPSQSTQSCCKILQNPHTCDDEGLSVSRVGQMCATAELDGAAHPVSLGWVC